MIREPKANGLSDTNKETDYCPKKFNRFWVMLGYGQHELLKFLDGITHASDNTPDDNLFAAAEFQFQIASLTPPSNRRASCSSAVFGG
jgi:hypothetical protein